MWKQTGVMAMAEEATKQVHLPYLDGDEVERESEGPSIMQVAMRHGRLDEDARVTDADFGSRSRGDVAHLEVEHLSAEEVVVDLRPGSLAESGEIAIDLTAIRELSVHPPTESVVPSQTIAFPAPRTDRLTDDVVLGDATPIGGLVEANLPQRFTKRMIDIIGALGGLLVVAPFILVVAMLVKITSPGPVLYRSTRVGRDGREFPFLKFRSMYDGAASDRASLDDFNEQTGPVFKIRSDPRITPFGRFLRKTSIDELPQLLHVLRGSMSLVGPRPALPDEAEDYDARARQRLLVKPGITCIWQVSGRSTVDFEAWVDMDLEYIRTWSLHDDLAILLQTIPAVVRGEGAY